MNFQMLYRSIFDLVRDFMKDEAFSQQDKTLRRYLNPVLCKNSHALKIFEFRRFSSSTDLTSSKLD
jgi:hypothetical protein